MRRQIVVAVLLFFQIYSSLAQFVDTSKVKWMTFDQVREAFYIKQKPIIIWVYTDDCDSCQLMLNKTFGNEEVANYINALFYPIKFNAKTFDTITFFNGRKFTHFPSQRYHSLVYTFFQNQISFPAMVVFDKYAQGRVFYGYKDRDHIFPILIYYAEEIYRSTNYNDFEKLFFKTYPPGVPQVISKLYIHWIPINEIDQEMQQHPKKIFMDIYNRYKVSPTIMRIQVFNNPIIANYLNTHFYPTTLEARGSDTVIFNGLKFPPSDKYPYNTLAIQLLGGKMQFPAFAFFDENYHIISIEKVFLTPEEFYILATYIGDDHYKKMSFEQYQKQYLDSLQPILKKIQSYYK